MRMRAAAGIAALFFMGATLGAGRAVATHGPAAADLAQPAGLLVTAATCDLKMSVADNPLTDGPLDVRVYQTYTMVGSGYAPNATVLMARNDIYSSELPPGSYLSVMTDASGSFEATGVFPGDDPYPWPETWFFTAQDAASGGCGDEVSVALIPATPFTDTYNRQVFRMDVIWLWHSAITAGCAETLFCPTSVVTREQMASFLVRALGLPATTSDFFEDDEASMHEANINRLAAAGITGGCAPGRFCPTATVTREQMASFLARAFDLPSTSVDYFTDDDTSIHESDINRLALSGITGGCDASRYCPTAPVTREQMAAFLHRALT